MPTAVHGAVMQSPLAFHCASAGFIQNEPVIEQVKKDALPVGDGLPTDPKCFAHAGISRFVLLSVARGRKQCSDVDRGQDSAGFHCCLNVEHEQVFRKETFPQPNAKPCSALGQSKHSRRNKLCALYPESGHVRCFFRWWAVTDSNRRHPACKAGALPTELTALAARLSPFAVTK